MEIRTFIFISVLICYSFAARNPMGREDTAFPAKVVDLKNYICWTKSSLLEDFFPDSSNDKPMFNLGVVKRIGGIDFADYFEKDRREREKQAAAAAAAAGIQ
ncbi:unnamed protein product [Allacma fusca]|uniref:Uncharacterized protein n=1 Tax=Allacma fusca TaxID=39272 RepID=A0A8J2JRT7_9HEXA|nr:unnamed protein product [Allacma fusca]